jgi:putative flippase GtrA
MSDTLTPDAAAPVAPRKTSSVVRDTLAKLTRMPKEVRYVAVGATCAILYNIMLIGTVALGVGHLWATVVVLPPIIIVGYSLHAAVTFETRFSAAAFLRYSLTILAGYPVWVVVLVLLADVAKLPIVIAAPLGTALMFGLNYVTVHWAILRSVRTAFDRVRFLRSKAPR